MEIEDVFAHNERWVAQQLQCDPDYFRRLSAHQQPEWLFFACSDSRISVESLLGTKPGDVFMHRNIGNVVPSNDLNALSVISYAVNHLRIKHIIVCGHYQCGGVLAAMSPRDEGLLNPWLRHIRDVYRIHRDQLNAIDSLEERYDRLVEFNVREQCINIVKTRDAQHALLHDRLQIHGWVFDMRSGRLIDLQLNMDEIMSDIMDVYDLFR
ncbi:MAG: carbonic anhydrase [Thermoanaerobaculaceae bacterium]|nr:carbonic anhydrase [Thermoanaerobaculaceae bacterium]MDI9622755.1 carbonic anhydrase [Acidobacteriota bacterium]